MGKAIFGKLNLFSKNTVNNLENIMNSVFTISENKKKEGVCNQCSGFYYIIYIILMCAVNLIK